MKSDIRKAIINGAKDKISYSILTTQFNVNKSILSRTIKTFNLERTYLTKSKSGRPKITSQKEGNILIRACKADPNKTAPILNAEMNKFHNIKCSVSTTKRRLNAANLFGFRPVKKPLVSVKNRRARV